MRILTCLLLIAIFFFPCSTIDAHASKAFVPVRIEIPQIKLKAAVEPVSVLANG